MTSAAPRLILASASPRRRQLLSGAGFQFEVVRPEGREISTDSLSARELSCWNALRKGLATARTHREAVVLAADTLVALDDAVIGKPADMTEAKLILRRLSGRKHTVASAIFIG